MTANIHLFIENRNKSMMNETEGVVQSVQFVMIEVVAKYYIKLKTFFFFLLVLELIYFKTGKINYNTQMSLDFCIYN